ncbi:MAG TPA: hypothetical protein EYP43_04130 [Thermoplasmata archaeon]|nr:hypothetical protein [Thermoplasmata archaeon]
MRWLLLALLMVCLAPVATGGPIAVAEVWAGEWTGDGAGVLQGIPMQFSAERSYGDDLTFTWDMDNWTDSDDNGDPTDDVDVTGANVTWTFTRKANITVTLHASNASGQHNDTLWINVTPNRSPAIRATMFTVLVGQRIDLLEQMEIEDPEGRPVVVRMDLDTLTDSDDPRDGDPTDDADLTWDSRVGGPLLHVFEEPGTRMINVSASDGFNTNHTLVTVTVWEAGTEVKVGDHYSNTDHLLMYTYRVYVLDLREGDRVKVIFRVVLGTGLPRILAMDVRSYARFSRYRDRYNFTPIDDLSEPNGTRSRIVEWTSDLDGHIHLVIDNGYLTGNASDDLKIMITVDVDRRRETPGPDAPLVLAAVPVAALLAGRRRVRPRAH